LLCIVLSACGGEEDDGVTYDGEVERLFRNSCTTCHHPTNPVGVDLQNPFAPERGLVNAPNTWAVDHPEAGLPERNVTPFEPENSFLMNKLTGDLPVDGNGGSSMPLQPRPLTPEQIAVLEQWIVDGAQPGPFFDANVRRIFGSPDSVVDYAAGRCICCHYEGSPNPLDLSDPFGPNGLVGVNATYRAGMQRVAPGDPEQSLLMIKVTAMESTSDYGAPMPYSFTKLTTAQVDIVRQWILEGARP
jgi:hypothetical protein